ncbi:MAG TPA: prepilin-type N-terminal cleavage/methylation domain-containing protein [Gammaproteobacteria bacterium]|nr:prepilin-type N-terminal cleavage/methylation domain-containing protein [Gammaproteobacteria bacterium]
MISPSRRQSGFSLIETILVIVLLGVAVAGMAAMFLNSVSKSHEPYLRQRALAVANAFMDEILRKRWDDNSPLGGGCVNTGTVLCSSGPVPAGIGNEEAARADWDDIDDFNAISNQSPPQDSAGSAMPGYEGFAVSVTVSQPGAWNGMPAADVKRIEVQVTSNNGETISLSAWRVNF